jgi:predicted RNA binding protein YcfA (HicA-like mRNA interferase family)
MAKVEKIIKKMQNNPRDWRIADLEVIAKSFGITIRKGKGSHVSFTHPHWMEILTVPAHCPIKPIYIKKLIVLVDMLKKDEI